MGLEKRPPVTVGGCPPATGVSQQLVDYPADCGALQGKIIPTHATTRRTILDKILSPTKKKQLPMNREDIRARMRRLESLVRGLGLEEEIWRKCSAPVLAVDRLAYIDAIHEAIHGLETARVTLAKMVRGLEEGN
jgi:hypothetical protein